MFILWYFFSRAFLSCQVINNWCLIHEFTPHYWSPSFESVVTYSFKMRIFTSSLQKIVLCAISPFGNSVIFIEHGMKILLKLMKDDWGLFDTFFLIMNKFVFAWSMLNDVIHNLNGSCVARSPKWQNISMHLHWVLKKLLIVSWGSFKGVCEILKK